MKSVQGREKWIYHISHVHEFLGVPAFGDAKDIRVDICDKAQEDIDLLLKKSSRNIEPIVEIFNLLQRFERGQPLRCYRSGPEIPFPALIVSSPIDVTYAIDAVLRPVASSLLVSALQERRIGGSPDNFAA